MKSLDLDYAPRRRPVSLAGIALLALAAAGTWATFDAYREARRASAAMHAERDRLAARVHGVSESTPRLDESTLGEIRSANRIIGQITLAWERLLTAVESASTPSVTLLALTPEHRTGSLQIVGEAADRDALFDYLNRLARQDALQNVYLLSHQANLRDPQQPLRFTVTASWTGRDSN